MWSISNNPVAFRYTLKNIRIYHGVAQSFTEYGEKENLNSVLLRVTLWLLFLILRGYIIKRFP